MPITAATSVNPLEEKYSLSCERAYLTGIDALVRLPMIQQQRDQDAGLHTAGFISGYRGSPLGTVDQAMWQAKQWLEPRNIIFQPGVNEDLAATAVWGTQQVHLIPKPKYDGVFSMWYGKGPGVDRSMDVLKHANAFGTTAHGGVLAIAGDDHACKSSTLPHQSEHMFIGATIPVLNPAGVQDVLDYGVYGWALSRFSGCWVAMKAITKNMDSAISADTDPYRVKIKLPEEFTIPAGGLNAQWPATPLEQEALLQRHRIYAARAFAYSNNLNKVVIDSRNPRLGIVTSGKSYLDVMEALRDLGIDNALAEEIGLRVYKVGMSWPLEPIATHEFARGLSEILIIEEKRSILEDQITGQLYNWPVSDRPKVVGEFDENGDSLVSNLSELTPANIALIIAKRINLFYQHDAIKQRVEFLQAKSQRLAKQAGQWQRRPHFCSGCPHNTSTKVPDGSVAHAGIGCHYMVRWMDRDTELFCQMGGEGATWIGQAPFTDTPHIFQNLGDGTYFHSGILAIRAAVASGVNITYKVLYNDAVAMTGGQPVDGNLSLRALVQQIQAEGVEAIAIVSEYPQVAKQEVAGLTGITLHKRAEFAELQSKFREIKGTSAIIYNQTCATEKRRRRKRGIMPTSDTRVFINPDICEGCGDCSKQSNCLSVLPKATPLGTKRRIDQDACNQDFSCLDGFCPSFVSIKGGSLKKPKAAKLCTLNGDFPEPPKTELAAPRNILITGVGGTGVLTVSAILGMACHLEKKGCTTLNQTGLAQKFGAVVSHVRIANSQDDIHAVRIPDGDCDLMIGADLVVSAMQPALARLDPDRSHCVINDYATPTSDFINDRDYQFPGTAMLHAIEEEAQHTAALDATTIARKLLGDSIGTNLLLTGYAYQLGQIPLQAATIERAIAINGVAVDFNIEAFRLGRRCAIDKAGVLAQIDEGSSQESNTLEELLAHRAKRLIDYQDSQLATRYRNVIDDFQQRISDTNIDAMQREELTQTCARQYYKLLAYKDEYEVARLLSSTDFKRTLNEQFDGDFRIQFHLAPPLLARLDKISGRPRKIAFPQVFLPLFKLLAHGKKLRGGRWDIFARSEERRLERQLITNYEQLMQQGDDLLAKGDYQHVLELFSLPDQIRGFGPVKLASIESAQQREQELLNIIKRPNLNFVVQQPN